MARREPLAGTPFYFLGPHPDREAELVSYICREHRRGRRLSAILEDGYVQRHGRRGVLRAVLRRPDLIGELRRDVADSIRQQQAEVSRNGRRRAGQPGSRVAGEEAS